MKEKVIAAVLCIILLTAGIYAAATPNHSKENAEPAAGEVISSTDLAMSPDEYEPPHTSRFDTTALDSWRGEPAGQIRMISGWYFAPDTIETEDGNLWELNTEDINEYELLLIWFDDMGTPEIEDDQIIKVWSEVYD